MCSNGYWLNRKNDITLFLSTSANIHLYRNGLRISDANISMNMKDIRGFHTDIYGMLTGVFQKALNDTDIDDLHGYTLSIIDDGEKAQIIINRELPLSSKPSLTLSYLDGILFTIWLGVLYYGKCWIDSKFK